MDAGKPEDIESRWKTVRECSGARTAGLGPQYPLASADFIVNRAGRGGAKREGTLTGSERTGKAWRERTQVDA